MKILVVYTHPHAKSLANALLQRVLKGLEAGGHEVDHGTKRTICSTPA